MSALRFSLGLLLMLAGSVPGMGQIGLTGRVTDEADSVLAGAMVQLCAPDSFSVIRFTRTDASGAWRLDKVKPGEYVLKIGYLGRETGYRGLNLKSGAPPPLVTVLPPQTQTLQVVDISARRLGIVVRGDTTFYNIGAYTDSTEYNLGDILNKLPGIQVTPEGILYNGARVKVALTEGQDIFGQLHKQMTESIRAEDVAGVQILERYQEGADQALQSGDDKVALNVTLTEEARNRLNGDAGAHFDLSGHYELNATGYKTGEKVGFTAIARVNNTAQPTLQAFDLLAMLDMDNPDKVPDQLDLIKTLVPPAGLRKSNEAFAFGRITAKPTPALTLKSTVSFFAHDRAARRNALGIYTNNNSVYIGNTLEKTADRNLNLDVQAFWKGARVHVDAGLPLYLHRTGADLVKAGLLDSNEIRNVFAQDVDVFSINPYAALAYLPGKNHSLRLNVRFGLKSTGQSTRLASAFPVFGQMDSSLVQSTENPLSDADVEIAYQFKQPKHQLTLKTRGYDHAFRYTLQTAPLFGADWQNRSDFRDRAVLGEAEWRRVGQQAFRYHFAVGAGQLTRAYEGGGGQFRQLLFSGKAGVYYDFDKTHRIGLNAEVTQRPPDMMQLIRVLQVVDDNILQLEQVDSQYVFFKRKVAFNYSNRDPAGQFDYFIKSAFEVLQNDILYWSEARENYLLNRSLRMPDTRVFELTVSGNLKAALGNKQPTLSLQGNVRRQNGYAAINETLQPTTLFGAGGSLSATFPLTQRWQWSAGYNLMYQGNETQSATPRLSFTNSTVSTGCRFKGERWFVTTQLAVKQQETTGSTNTLWLLGFEAEYRLPKSPLRLRLVGRNLLNLDGNQLIVPDFNLNYLGYDQFTTIGGMVLAGVAWVF
ncbi:MAG: carboxypeptidase-like regulatory domain-containing protein [Saprospiraceae bacterium]|nr:carboxypeptidase-like regulatory domain-containing protein [Saprospiraceae bacterium]